MHALLWACGASCEVPGGGSSAGPCVRGPTARDGSIVVASSGVASSLGGSIEFATFLQLTFLQLTFFTDTFVNLYITCTSQLVLRTKHVVKNGCFNARVVATTMLDPCAATIVAARNIRKCRSSLCKFELHHVWSISCLVAPLHIEFQRESISKCRALDWCEFGQWFCSNPTSR